MKEYLNKMMDDVRTLSDERLRNWCIWKIALPLILFCMLYWACRSIIQAENPFAEAFAHGDLLLFSGLILMEAAVEGEHIREKGGWYSALMSVGKLLAIVFLIAFAVTKIDVMRYQSEEVQSQAILAKMTGYSLLNWSIAIFSVLYSIAGFAMTLRKERDERLTAMASIAVAEAQP